MGSNLHTAPGMGCCEEGSCTSPGVGWCSSEGLHSHAGHKPWSSSPRPPWSDHEPCFVFQSSLTTATLAERITQVCCCHCNPKRHNPNSGSAPQLPVPHPGGAGLAAMPRNHPAPLADGLPLPRGPTSGAPSCAPEFTSRGAGGRQSHRGAFPHCPDWNRIIPFPELPECQRGECGSS